MIPPLRILNAEDLLAARRYMQRERETIAFARRTASGEREQAAEHLIVAEDLERQAGERERALDLIERAFAAALGPALADAEQMLAREPAAA